VPAKVQAMDKLQVLMILHLLEMELEPELEMELDLASVEVCK